MNDDRWTMRNPLLKLALIGPIFLLPMLALSLRAGWIGPLSLEFGFAAVSLMLIGYVAITWKMALVRHRDHPLGEPDNG